MLQMTTFDVLMYIFINFKLLCQKCGFNKSNTLKSAIFHILIERARKTLRNSQRFSKVFHRVSYISNIFDICLPKKSIQVQREYLRMCMCVSHSFCFGIFLRNFVSGFYTVFDKIFYDNESSWIQGCTVMHKSIMAHDNLKSILYKITLIYL